MIGLTDWIQLFAAIFSAGGVWFVYLTLKADHDWRRRQYALDIIAKWNVNAIEHIKIIEKRFPHIRYDITAEITKAQALDIYKGESKDDATNIELRAHCIQLLNFFEFICIAYSQGIADKEIVEHSMKGSITIWYDKLRNFIEVVEEVDGYQPWSPFLEVVMNWKKTGLKLRKPTA